MTRLRTLVLLTLLALLALGSSAPAPARAGEITLDVERNFDAPPKVRFPLRGELLSLTVTEEGIAQPGVVVEVLYRPNTQTSRTETLAPTDARGTTSWTPSDPGLVTLTASRELPGGEVKTVASRNVAVRFGGFPPSGIAIMLIAGLMLFGGALFGFWLLMKDDLPSSLETESPST